MRRFIDALLARSLFVVVAFVIAGSSARADEVIPFITQLGRDTRWYDAQHFTLEGRGWSDVAAPYDRFPAKAEKIVRERVWELSRHSAGMSVHFTADTPEIEVRWKVTSEELGKPHMAPTGVSGIDLYGRTDDGRWRWIACGRPSGLDNRATLAKELPAGKREYRLYLPLYNGTSLVEIGLPPTAAVARSTNAALKQKPIVFYGTSIMQGACASRPGMAQGSIIGRRLERPIINLGFAGQGKMEIEVAKLLAELDPAVYVLDCLANCGASEIKVRTEPLVLELRKARPNVPIILVEDRTYADSHWTPSRLDRNVSSRKAYRKVYDKLLAAGVTGLTYVEGGQLLRDDGEDTVDGSHPTDLGFMRYADILAPIITGVLPK